MKIQIEAEKFDDPEHCWDQCKAAWKKSKEATIIDINEQWGVSPHQ